MFGNKTKFVKKKKKKNRFWRRRFFFQTFEEFTIKISRHSLEDNRSNNLRFVSIETEFGSVETILFFCLTSKINPRHIKLTVSTELA